MRGQSLFTINSSRNGDKLDTGRQRTGVHTYAFSTNARTQEKEFSHFLRQSVRPVKPRVSAPQPSCSLVPAPQNGSHNRSTSPCHYPFHTNECHTSRLRSRFEIIVEVSLPSSPRRARNETCKKSAPDGNQTHTALETPCATEGAVHEKRRHARTHARTHERSRRRRLGLARCACTGAVSSCRCRVPSHEGHRSRRRWRRR